MISVDVLLETVDHEPDATRAVAFCLILALAEAEGPSSPTELARIALLRRDPRLDEFSARLPGVLTALVRAGVVKRRGGRLSLPPEVSTAESRRRLVSICERRLAEPVPDAMRAQTLVVFGGRCADCGRQVDPSLLQVGLIIPRSRGGMLSPSNLEAICSACSAQRDLPRIDETAQASDPSPDPACPFCNPGRMPTPVASAGTVFAIGDRNPVSAGHLLVIPRRHTPTYFTMTSLERRDADSLLRYLKNTLERDDPTIQGFNIGANCGELAGQTIFHAHIHLIPRRAGDTARPRGGVRGVIPDRMGY